MRKYSLRNALVHLRDSENFLFELHHSRGLDGVLLGEWHGVTTGIVGLQILSQPQASPSQQDLGHANRMHLKLRNI